MNVTVLQRVLVPGVLAGPGDKVRTIDSGTGGDREIPFVDPQTLEPTPATVGNTARVIESSLDAGGNDLAFIVPGRGKRSAVSTKQTRRRLRCCTSSTPQSTKPRKRR